MIEKTIYEFLTSEMDVPVYTQIPVKPAAEYVAFERTGGRERNHIKYATVAIQSVAGSLIRAIELNAEVIESVTGEFGIRSLANIASASLNSTYNFTDTETKVYRYQAVFDITYTC